ncbi:unnamed protein product [Dovyalis caffra]|uniref:Pentatricopeptide repeat-containing protein n=1 Tax=Dovyalis caffra TaxID=77055 RepID=A0AAV1RLR5_9ROSI|nr:unnamed protein product [Dovyalis caffra]
MNWTLLIAAYGQEGLSNKVIRLFREMDREEKHDEIERGSEADKEHERKRGWEVRLIKNERKISSRFVVGP